MTINSRLLACKTKIEEALYYANLALRVDPYFHILALSQSLPSLTFMIQLYSNHYN
jgi:hypothetical protein